MSAAALSLRARLDARLIGAPVREPMSVSRIMAYALPFMPLSALSTPITVYVPPFFTQNLGVSLSAAGLIFMLSRFWDIFTDPLMGVMSDRYPTRYGRRRHWLILSLPILIAASFLVFMPQIFIGERASPLYLLAALFVLYLGYTLAVLSHMSWGAELATGYHERSRIQGWREFVHVIGMVSVLAIPIAFEQTGNAHDRGGILAAVGWYVIILLPLTTLIAIFSVGERPAPPTPKTEWREGLRLIVKNRLLIRLLVVDVLLASPIAIMGALTAFFFEFVLESPQLTAIGLLAYFVVSLAGVPLWIWLGRYIPKHRAIALAALLHSFNIFSMFRLGPGDGYGMVTYFVLAGIVYGGSTFMLRSMMADITDDDNVKSGSQRTGLIFSLMAMTAKAVPALGVGLTYPLLDLAGFDPRAEVVTPEAIQSLRYIFILFPSALALTAAALIVNFPLDAARQQQLRQMIEQRQSGNTPPA